jgi:hypothetical protein
LLDRIVSGARKGFRSLLKRENAADGSGERGDDGNTPA